MGHKVCFLDTPTKNVPKECAADQCDFHRGHVDLEYLIHVFEISRVWWTQINALNVPVSAIYFDHFDNVTQSEVDQRPLTWFTYFAIEWETVMARLIKKQSYKLCNFTLGV